jgi:hypothetical protein
VACFEPALKSGIDLMTVRRCFVVLEAMLSCPDRDVEDAAGIRVTPYLMDPAWTAMVDRFAGPRTLADLQRLGRE